MSETIAFSPTVSGHDQNGVLVVMLDNPPVNATSAVLRHGLLAALHYLHATASLSAMVLSGVPPHGGSNHVGLVTNQWGMLA